MMIVIQCDDRHVEFRHAPCVRLVFVDERYAFVGIPLQVHLAVPPALDHLLDL